MTYVWQNINGLCVARHELIVSHHTYAGWLIQMCDMTHLYVWDDAYSYVWHDSFIWATWLLHMCDMTPSYGRHDSFICVTWLVHLCAMTHSYVCHDSFMWFDELIFHHSFMCSYERRIHMCAMTHSYVCHDSFMCSYHHMKETTSTWRSHGMSTWRSHGTHMKESWHTYDAREPSVRSHGTHMCSYHDSFMCSSNHQDSTSSYEHMKEWWNMSSSNHSTFIRVTWLIHMCDMTHSYVCHDSFICVTWLIHMCDKTSMIRATSHISHMKLQVSFAKEPYKRDPYRVCRAYHQSCRTYHWWRVAHISVVPHTWNYRSLL